MSTLEGGLLEIISKQQKQVILPLVTFVNCKKCVNVENVICAHTRVRDYEGNRAARQYKKLALSGAV